MYTTNEILLLVPLASTMTVLHLHYTNRLRVWFACLRNDLTKQVRQQDAYLAIRPAYPRGCCPRAAKRIKKLHALLVSLYF